MGLTLNVFRSASLGDCSNGGLSGRVDEVTVVNVPGPFVPTEARPAVLLVEGNVPGSVKVVPAVQDETGAWVPEPHNGRVGPMSGGTFVGTTDGRFIRLAGAQVVSLHDRFETTAQYAALST